MKRKDIPAVMRIDEKITRTRKERKKLWKAELETNLRENPRSCLVADLNSRIVGFMFGSIREWMFGIEKNGWIESLGVDPEFMGKGIGKKLGQALLNYFEKEGVQAVHTVAPWDSGDLLAFFKALGFDRSALISLTKTLKKKIR